MSKEICRAITFINYHIPLASDLEIDVPYSTIGFFDGMITELLAVDYKQEELKALWRYGLYRTAKSVGQYSYQNIFCFSDDDWNEYEDTYFWDKETNKIYPLTFVVFLQQKNYQNGDNKISEQCRGFNQCLKQSLGTEGIFYSYCTIDKNDFVVCLKCSNYKKAVSAIKALHMAGKEVVYSYTVFSVYNDVLRDMTEKSYPALFDKSQNIESICLKGITNSFSLDGKTTLDQKYYEFYLKLVDKLYDGNSEKYDSRIYDILGDDDFRLIARDVNLGRLLRQFAPGGLLHYKEKAVRFYLFSSSLVLNTETPVFSEIDQNYKKNCIKKMEQEFCSPVCTQLQSSMTRITSLVTGTQKDEYDDEKVLSFSHAIWQLLQSMKALESAPTKKYDFQSLYHPLSLLIEILEEKLDEIYKEHSEEKRILLRENAEIYDFIHKISMTLHGTLRTDIQFFQIRDFNVIVHYAPAKLRAYYALWSLEVSEFYNDFCTEKNKYSFVFSPGMFREIQVKSLSDVYAETKRIMLITVPERQLYRIKHLSVMLAHETAHFVGYTVRNRPRRHEAWMRCCARVLQLEMEHFRYIIDISKWQTGLDQSFKESRLYEQFMERLAEEDVILQKEEAKWPHTFHSRNSFQIIKKAFRNVARNGLEKIVTDECERINLFLERQSMIGNMPLYEQMKLRAELKSISDSAQKQMLIFYGKFQRNFLPQLLNMLRNITGEAYADLNAVLTLNLTPMEYLLSFTRGELEGNKEELKNKDALLLVVRMALTIQAIQHIVETKGDFVQQITLAPEWSEDVIRILPNDPGLSELENRIATLIYGYITRIRNCNDAISSYGCVYNYLSDIEEFTNSRLDFLRDQIIWGELSGYMNKCAEDYLKILVETKGLKEQRQHLVDTYGKINESMLSMTQEIENFLAAYCTHGKKQ